MGCDREDDVGGRVLSFAFSGSGTRPWISFSLSLFHGVKRGLLFFLL